LYLKPNRAIMIFDKKAELNVLINLAASDRNVAERESKLIHLIAKANGISKEDVDSLLNSPHPIGNINSLTADEKFEHLYQLIQLMKMDGQVFRSEIVFCEQIAEKVGFKKAVVAEISQHVYSDPSITADRDMVKTKALKFLKA
jgi:uncharacterized tellurite resistance protein B-like protein